MKKYVAIWLAFLLAAAPIASFTAPAVHAAYVFSGGGDGSLGDPYVILTAEDLDHVRDNMTANYKLGADIDLSAIPNWSPIGRDGHQFRGNFDGDFHMIRGMTIHSSANEVGLFGVANGVPSSPTSLKNVRLEEVAITTTSIHAQAGGLVGTLSNYASIEGVFVSGVINGQGFSAGGVAGQVNNRVSISGARVDISGHYRYAGGLIGYSGVGRSVEQSYATGDITLTSGESAGGLIGHVVGTSIINSYALGHIELPDGKVGSLIGNVDYLDVRITNSYAAGSVNAVGGSAGGVVGAKTTPPGFSQPHIIDLINVYWNDSVATLNAIGGESGREGAANSEDLMRWDTFDGWDAAIWGLRESQTMPYLKRYAPEFGMDALESSYNTAGPGSVFQVKGTVRDGSIGEQLVISLRLENSTDTTVAESTYTLYANGVKQPVEWSLTFDDIQYPAGTYHLVVTVEDTVGSNTYEEFFFFDIHDTTKPAAPVLTRPVNGARLNAATPTITGTAEPHSTVTVVIDGVDAGKTTAGAGGDWEWIVALALGEGEHTVAARAEDAAGNVSTNSTSLTFTVDLDPPVITLRGDAVVTILAGDTFVDPGATAMDVLDGAVNVIIAGHVDQRTPGTYVLTYNAQDSAGNFAAEVKRTVHVNERSSGSGSVIYLSGNIELKELLITENRVSLKLTPPFATGTASYQLDTSARQIEVQATTAYAGAVVLLNGEKVPASGTWIISLVEGDNIIEIKVTAENGTSQLYLLNVVRHADSGQPTNCPFRDIAGHWAEGLLCEAAKQGIVEGDAEGFFHPQRSVTRIEFAAMLLRALNARPVGDKEELAFTDASIIPVWALDTARDAVRAGIIQGYPDGTLRPLQTVSRSEMAAMMGRARQVNDVDGNVDPFVDDDHIPAWARAAIYDAAKDGILTGRGNNEFVPKGLATRAEAAVSLLRLHHYYALY